MKVLCVLVGLAATVFANDDPSASLNVNKWKQRLATENTKTFGNLKGSLKGSEKTCFMALWQAMKPGVGWDKLFEIQSTSCDMTPDEFQAMTEKIEKVQAKVSGDPAPVRNWYSNAELSEVTGIEASVITQTLGDDGSLVSSDVQETGTDQSGSKPSVQLGPAVQILPIVENNSPDVMHIMQVQTA